MQPVGLGAKDTFHFELLTEYMLSRHGETCVRVVDLEY